MLTSLFTGISGLNANSLALSVVGDNIANANTVGFKSSRANFGDILSQTLGGASAMQVGRGAMIIDIQKMFTQGTLETTANPLDLAIEGDGFFIVRQLNGPTYYTRAGQFRLDKDGYVVDPNGYRLQAYQMNPDGTVTGAIGDIYLAGLMSEPRATNEVKIQVNLDSRQTVPSQPWTSPSGPNLPDPNTYNFSTAITIYDSQGNPHLVYTYFVKTAANQWTAYMVYDSSSDPTNPNYTEAGSFNITFDENGRLTTDPPTSSFNFDFTPWGAAAQNVTFNFTDSTQFGSPNAVVFQTQNGYSSGNLIAVTVDQDGVISGVFTNGQVKKVAQVVLAKFVAAHNLTKVGKNLFLESYGSGNPTYGAPGTVGVGKVFANSLEASNVDLAEEFVRMIAAQRGYQANVRVITTTDNMLNELMNIVR
ncbi:MAG: flagellar hook protein FlgE [Thermodesulfovibrio sp.]|jgi:flagellar hook protein FlgE|uniref:flagellar hook protein FlgE n=1 Tax=Thermodesulfovibrio sp. N1 TaxID=1871110 RepID=UPI00083B3C61|nr:flagellar hook protein FlgE [Thermodesulfovibrio sp. N1]MDI6713794.1 flagellar hook protein FlgE [Thermodesulfovibrio sp.]ODA45134.1 Flagellar hook protein FlgE [Thermodesulfovibrio sp. N1]